MNDYRVHFSEEEKEYMFSEDLAVRLMGFLQINQKARDIIKKHIKSIEEDKLEIVKIDRNFIKTIENEELKNVLLSDLKHGDEVLEGGQERFMRDGLKGMEANLKRSKRGRRPGFGLSRGFGEFLHCYQGDWTSEIMDAVRKIEHYYNNM